MIQFLPRQISNKAITVYLISLAIVSLAFASHKMKLIYIIIGIVWVSLFFILSSQYSQKWIILEKKKFIRKLFFTALFLRVFWVFFSYIFYTIETGIPFEFGSSDAWEYHDMAIWLNEIGRDKATNYIKNIGLSDTGYPLYLTILYWIYGPNIILTRILKALLSSWTCIHCYKIAQRNFGESVGRMAGIFICLMPNLIMYCGLHLKETEMIFLTMACLERADNLIHSSKIKAWNIISVILLGASLFTFRTVMGATVMFSIFTALLFTRTNSLSKWNRLLLIIWAVSAVLLFAGGRISNEIQQTWEGRSSNQQAKRDYQVYKGISWAKYATGTVMAPMMFVLPFPTMVDVDRQYNQQLINGGNYVKNFMGIFVVLTVISAIFIKRNWRDFSLIGAFVISYLGVICMSGFANSERFLLPGVPALMILAAYGVSIVSPRNYRYVRYWYIFVPIMIIAWAFFKLGSRSLI